jgi:hypothetical protein
MSDSDTIKVVEVQETDFGEKAVIDSPYESRHAIKHLPWNEYQEEIDEHGSLEGKAQDRGTNTKTSELIDVFDSMEQYGFSPDLATHVSWDPDALGGDGAWTIDVDAVDEVADFWEFLGYSVEIQVDI